MNWVAYWRKNPQRFAKEYLEMNLFLYQKILIFMIERTNTFMYITSRGQGGLTCLARMETPSRNWGKSDNNLERENTERAVSTVFVTHRG